MPDPIHHVRAESVEREGISPSTFSIDFNQTAGTEGPFMVGFSFWVVQADPAAGVVTGDFEWEDPTGQLRVLNGTPISLADPTGFYQSPMYMVQRHPSGSGIYRFNFTLNSGTAETSLIAYRVMTSPYGDNQAPFWPSPP